MLRLLLCAAIFILPSSVINLHAQTPLTLERAIRLAQDSTIAAFESRYEKESRMLHYDEFMALAQQCHGMTEEQMKPIFYPRFGKTFYYEYFLIRNQKLY